MENFLPTEKLDRNNYASLSYKMHQYILRHNTGGISRERIKVVRYVRYGMDTIRI